jgi:hypothetical protein
MKPLRRALALLLCCPLLGCPLLACGAVTEYRPRIVSQHELTLAYADGLQVYAGRELLTEAPRFSGLAEYVHCVPRAAEHADDAQGHGQAATGLAVTGVVLGAGSLGGLSGLAFLEGIPAPLTRFLVPGSRRRSSA